MQLEAALKQREAELAAVRVQAEQSAGIALRLDEDVHTQAARVEEWQRRARDLEQVGAGALIVNARSGIHNS